MSNIVIYEENDLMRALLEEWLSEAGYRVLATASHDLHGGTLADLVIVSVYMPKRAGARLVREIQALYPGTPLIAISGQFLPGFSASGAIARALGVQRVIAKPLARIDLLAAVRSLIGEPGSGARLVVRNAEPKGCREMSGNVRAIPAGDQRSRIDVCVGTSESTSCLRNNTRPLGVR
jgi:CheY-like chemotaxis protein